MEGFQQGQLWDQTKLCSGRAGKARMDPAQLSGEWFNPGKGDRGQEGRNDGVRSALEPVGSTWSCREQVWEKEPEG